MEEKAFAPYPERIGESRAFCREAKWIGAACETVGWDVFRRVWRGKKPERAVLLLSAGDYARVFINGKIAAQYVTRSHPFEKAFDVLDVTPFFDDGENVITILAHPYRPERHGVIAQFDLTVEGKTETVCTDERWKWKRDEAVSADSDFFVPAFAGEEIVFADREDALLFTAGYDDADWKNAAAFPCDYTLAQNPCDPQTFCPVTPKTLSGAHFWQKRNGYAFHLARGGTVTAMAAEMTAETDTTVSFAFVTAPRELTLDGAPVSCGVSVPITAGRHTLGFLLTQDEGGDPEFAVETDGKLAFSSVLREGASFIRLSRSAPSREYPWNEPITAVSVPEDFYALIFSGDLSRLPEKLAEAVEAAEEKPISHTGDLLLRKKTAPWEIPAGDGMDSPLVLPVREGADGACLTFDFGEERVGLLSLDWDAPAGTKLEFHGFELVSDRGDEFMGTKNTMTVYAREGRQRYTARTRRGFRYARVWVSGYTRPVTLFSLSVLDMRYPGKECEPFSSDDAALDTAYEMSMRTARLCMLDRYVDCPGHEQNVWTGDARVTAQANLLNVGAFPFDRAYLRLIGETLGEPFQTLQWGGHRTRFDSAGRFFAVGCYPRYPRGGIPVWAFQWLLQTYDHYMATGDKAALAEVFLFVTKQLENCFMLTGDRGLLDVPGAWNLIEWAENDLLPCGEVVGNTAMLVLCLKTAAREAAVLGETEKERLFLAKAEAYAAAVNRTGWSEDARAYVDSVRDEYAHRRYTDFCEKKGWQPLSYAEFRARERVSVQTNTLAYLAGIVPAEREADAVRFLIDNMESGVFRQSTPAAVRPETPTVTECPRGYVPIGSPFFLFFAYDALCRLGRQELMLTSIRREWGEMAERGTNTCWETFRHGPGWTRSIAHAWSASPAIYLKTEILGVKPLSPGYATFTVVPHPCGLSHAEGAVATPYGNIFVSWTVRNGKPEITVSAPKECQYMK